MSRALYTFGNFVFALIMAAVLFQAIVHFQLGERIYAAKGFSTWMLLLILLDFLSSVVLLKYFWDKKYRKIFEDSAIPLETVREIIVSDNGNAGDASDIEINFRTPINDQLVDEYRVYFIKADQAENFMINNALSASADRYTIIQPEEIYPIKGKVIDATARDTDGDLISNGIPYVAGILSKTRNKAKATNAFVKDDKTFELRINNQVVPHSPEIDGGSGGLVMNENGILFMSGYDIQGHLSEDREPNYSIYWVEVNGLVREYSTSHRFLSGIWLDGNDNLYLSMLFDRKLIKFDTQAPRNHFQKMTI